MLPVFGCDFEIKGTNDMADIAGADVHRHLGIASSRA
jgi:hypothetical protein